MTMDTYSKTARVALAHLHKGEATEGVEDVRVGVDFGSDSQTASCPLLLSGATGEAAAAVAVVVGAHDMLDLCAGEFVSRARIGGDAKPGLWVLADVSRAPPEPKAASMDAVSVAGT